MCHYRLYALCANDRIRSGADLQAPGDEEAVALASQTLARPWELWTGARLVKKAERQGELETAG